MILFVSCICLLYLLSLLSKKTEELNKGKTSVLKAVMAIIIVLHHMSLQGIESLMQFFSWGAPIVSVFFFISGYGLSLNFFSKGNTYLSNFISHRIFRNLLLPFILAWALYRIINWCFLPDLVTEINNLVFKGITLLPHSWYVYAILLFYIFFYIACKLSEKNFPFIIVTLTIVYILVCEYAGFDRCWYISSLAFPTGVFAGKYIDSLKEFASIGIRYLMFVPLCISLIGLFVYSRNEILYMFVYILIPIMITMICLKIKLEELCRFKSVSFLSNISYEIYLGQGISMSMCRGNRYYIENDYMYILLVLIMTVVLAFLINKMRIVLESVIFKVS